MRIIDCKQGSGEWHGERLGRATASRAKDVLDLTLKGVSSAKREAYKAELVMSMLTGNSPDHYVSDDMKFGTEMEPLARTAYSFRKDVEVEQIGLAVHESIERFACSPDGLIGADGGLEIKVPRITTFIKWCKEYQHTKAVPEDHYWQCMAGMAVCERQWWDFAAYCPDMPRHMNLLIIRVPRDESAISKLEAGVIQFLDEVDADIAAMESLFGKAPAVKQEPTLQSEYGITNADIAWIQEQQRI